MIVITDPEAIAGGLCRHCIEFGRDLADIRLRLPASRVDVRLNDRLDAKPGCELTDRVVVLTHQVDVCRGSSQAVLGQSVAQFVGKVEERERLDMVESEGCKLPQRAIEILGEGVAHRVQLDG
jgi:hypothetical protein